jgi:hypothetical protein
MLLLQADWHNASINLNLVHALVVTIRTEKDAAKANKGCSLHTWKIFTPKLPFNRNRLIVEMRFHLYTHHS